MSEPRAVSREGRPAAGQLDLFTPPSVARPAPPGPPSTATPGSRAETFLSRLRALGLRGIRRCTLTANRSTVISFRADRLRVQRAFVDAPGHLLRAIVDFVNGRGAVRRRARRALLAFELPATTARPRAPHGREKPNPADAALVEHLRDAHRRFNAERFAGALSERVAIRISRRMRTRLGHYSPGTATTPPEIAIARRHLRRDGWASAYETLVHEMIHQWQHETSRPLAHDRDFRKKARAVGISGRAQRRD